ncbi:hypothetical protein QZH41_006516 [Actinostola sp. cb2023]|nr:hypothetical protein QZH41_006516 [Actinostola sp. cb2023]
MAIGHSALNRYSKKGLLKAMDTEWTEYQCKSGQTMFIYNKGSSEDNIMMGQPIIYKEFCSVTTQTDDYGCSNGCTSMYINTGSQWKEAVVLEWETFSQCQSHDDSDDDVTYIEHRGQRAVKYSDDDETENASFIQRRDTLFSRLQRDEGYLQNRRNSISAWKKETFPTQSKKRA